MPSSRWSTPTSASAMPAKVTQPAQAEWGGSGGTTSGTDGSRGPGVPVLVAVRLCGLLSDMAHPSDGWRPASPWAGRPASFGLGVCLCVVVLLFLLWVWGFWLLLFFWRLL